MEWLLFAVIVSSINVENSYLSEFLLLQLSRTLQLPKYKRGKIFYLGLLGMTANVIQNYLKFSLSINIFSLQPGLLLYYSVYFTETLKTLSHLFSVVAKEYGGQ